jgi:hypothetical protein
VKESVYKTGMTVWKRFKRICSAAVVVFEMQDIERHRKTGARECTEYLSESKYSSLLPRQWKADGFRKQKKCFDIHLKIYQNNAGLRSQRHSGLFRAWV